MRPRSERLGSINFLYPTNPAACSHGDRLRLRSYCRDIGVRGIKQKMNRYFDLSQIQPSIGYFPDTVVAKQVLQLGFMRQCATDSARMSELSDRLAKACRDELIWRILKRFAGCFQETFLSQKPPVTGRLKRKKESSNIMSATGVIEKIPASEGPKGSEDLSKAIEQSVEKQSDEQVRTVRLFDDYYRCNWWKLDSAEQPHWLSSGRIIKSRFFRVTRAASGLVFEDMNGRIGAKQ